MILEAFSHILKEEFSTQRPAAVVLQQWLLAHLLDNPARDACWIHNVLQTELEAIALDNDLTEPSPSHNPGLSSVLWSVQARTDTGEVLLKSLLDYCQSYEDWQYRRWLHHVHASDFCELPPDPHPDGQHSVDGRFT